MTLLQPAAQGICDCIVHIHAVDLHGAHPLQPLAQSRHMSRIGMNKDEGAYRAR